MKMDIFDKIKSYLRVSESDDESFDDDMIEIEDYNEDEDDSEIKNASVIVAESGIYEHSQLKELHAQGADAFLIGEHFMRQEDLAKAVKTVKEG